jgi:diaminohydroxyphosphoribosylaminopyrimidine deaminase/5-amino-6-(5-phosphoribosylamino)uracil reductase
VPSPGARLFSDGAGPVLVLVADTAPASADALSGGQVRVKRYPGEEGIGGMLRALAAEGVDDVVLEAGPNLFAAVWEAGAIDELVVLTAGGVGGAAAVDACPLVGDSGATDLAPRMRAVESAVVGDDAVTVWRPLEA